MKYETIEFYIPEIHDGAELLFCSGTLKIDTCGLYLITGANGCGKSTLLRMVLGLNNKTGYMQNKVKVLRPSYLPERLYVDGRLKVASYLESWNSIYQNLGLHDTKKYVRLYEAFNIKSFQEKTFSDLSKGMLQKVFLLLCLGRQSGFFLLDEPFNGLDSETKEALTKEISSLAAQDSIVWIVSHDTDLLLSQVDNVLLIENKKVTHLRPDTFKHVKTIASDETTKSQLFN